MNTFSRQKKCYTFSELYPLAFAAAALTNTHLGVLHESLGHLLLQKVEKQSRPSRIALPTVRDHGTSDHGGPNHGQGGLPGHCGRAEGMFSRDGLFQETYYLAALTQNGILMGYPTYPTLAGKSTL